MLRKIGVWFALLLLGIPFGTDAAPSQAVTYRLTEAFYEGRQVYYYTFENGTPILDEGARVGVGVQYHLVDAEGNAIEGQWDIVPANANEVGYSDLREIIEVTVPEDYVANSITHATELAYVNWEQTRTGEARNIPLARNDPLLQARDRDPITLWVNNVEVAAFDFGVTPAETAPIYVLISGFDEEGNPVRVNHAPVIEHMHADEGYSDFWQVTFVTVPEDTQPNAYRSIAELEEAGFLIEPVGNVVNCPAIRLEQMQVAYHEDVAYNVTVIARLDLEPTAEMPALYQYIYDDGVPLVDKPILLDTSADADTYTGYCEITHIYFSNEDLTSVSALAEDENVDFRRQGYVSTCAYMSAYLPSKEE